MAKSTIPMRLLEASIPKLQRIQRRLNYVFQKDMTLPEVIDHLADEDEKGNPLPESNNKQWEQEKQFPTP